MDNSDFAKRLASLSPDKQALFRQKVGSQRSFQDIHRIPRRKGDGRVLATPAQEQLWFLERLYPETPVYNLPFRLRLKQSVDLASLDAAFGEIVRRHEALRTVFVEEEGQIWQQVLPAFSPELVYVDLRAIAAADRAVALQDELDGEASATFVLSKTPLVRLKALRLEERDWLLAATFHHIIADAWSLAIFGQELRTLLESYGSNGQPPLPALPIQYVDYAEWQRSPERQDVRNRQLRYWQQKLAGINHSTGLVPSRRAERLRTFDGALEYFSLGASASRLVNAYLPQATPYMVLLAAFFAILHRELGQEDLIVGSPVADRRYREIEPLIGFFLNFLMLRVEIHGEMPFREVLTQTRTTVIEALENQDVALQHVLEHLGHDRAATFPYNITFGLQPSGGQESAVPAEGSSAGNATSKFDFSMILIDTPEGYAGVVEYRTGLFDAATVRRLVSSFKVLLNAALQAPDIPISALPLQTPEQQNALIARSAGPDIRHELRNLADRFSRWAAERPDAPALVGEASLTYAQLDAACDHLAEELRAGGLAKGAVVAVVLERGAHWVCAFLAVLKAGGVYLPVDPNYPAERIDYVLKDAQARFAIASPELHVAALDALTRVAPALSTKGGRKTEQSACTSNDTAYAIYTSGSTGPPKAALLSHGGLARLAEAQAMVFAPGPSDRVLSLSSLSFDASVFELSMALAHGAALCLASPERLLPGPQLDETLRETGTTILVSPPSVLSVVPQGALPDLRMVIVAGEPCPASLVDKWQPGRRFFNAYGPTECTIWSTIQECFAGHGDPSVGKPIPGSRIYIIDAYENLCPEGSVGEIAIGGGMVGLGYLNRPELTEARFQRDPFSPQSAARRYRSGDRGRILADGTIEFLGRQDRQVKVRGFRVEPGELEFALDRLPQVTISAVLTEPAGDSDFRLIAYVVPCAETSEAAIQRDLASTLPPFLLPVRIHLISEIPRTANGKTDYKTLRNLNPPAEDAAREFPFGDVEQKLAQIWRELLGRSEIFSDSEFFLLGGHSLLVGRLLVRVRDTFGVELTLKEVFEAPQFRAMAGRIRQIAPLNGPQGDLVLPAARTRISATELRSRSGYAGRTGP